MMCKSLITVFTSLALLGATAVAQGASPTSAAGLESVDSKRLSEVRLAPDADLALYRQVVVDDVEVEFARWWVRQVNQSGLQLRGEDIERIRGTVADTFMNAYTAELERRGFTVLDGEAAPEGDVLRITPRLEEVDVFPMDVGMNRFENAYGQSIGEMTLVIEVRDVATGRLLASVQDRKRDRWPGAPVTRNASTFELRFGRMVEQWADALDAELLGRRASLAG